MADNPELSEDELVELSLLRDFEIDELIKAGLINQENQLKTPLDQELIFEHEELILHVTAGPFYPAMSVTWKVENTTLPRKMVDELRAQLRQIAEAAETTNNISKWRGREESEFGVFEPTMAVLELATKTNGYLKAWRKSTANVQREKSYLPFETKIETLEKPAMTISDMGYHYLQKTPKEICSQIPSNYRIIHVEEVLRVDLVHRFHEKQRKMRNELSKIGMNHLRRHVPPNMQSIGRKDVWLDHLVKPHVTFHGTARQFVPSIVRHGFLQPGKRKPGTNEQHEVRCGSTYGRGIYSSPNPEFSLSYTDTTCHATKPNEYFGIKLIVCATLMGRAASITRDDNWRTQTESYPGSDSHIANRDLEYIVFDTAQILPVYVIHIDWGQDNAEHFEGLPRDPNDFVPIPKKRHAKLLEDIRWPGDVKRERAATFARATKWFPYGYGPSTGARFVVEEIGDVDEDEEDYGDYQNLRIEGIKDKSNLDFWSWVKVGVDMDVAGKGDPAGEYTKQRFWHAPEALGIGDMWDDLPDPRKESDDEKHDWDDDGGDLGLDLMML
ncbi:ADP-ribosylation [Annulohypoxylon maeteangense]|uniref:ADP-ribosylation n=1 Tax=Annulohypoxylon maeteangense TaxID=1927788 RepID=UPI0020089E56|nr:ADP-ribosylation [Annulohypoxylon maeteangense]KAI0888914.1 ADP-ribosylation [Annulohypoxylon maeteangense]